MSSIVSFDSGTTIAGANLEIVAPQGEANIIDVKGDSPITIFGGVLDDTVTLGAGDGSVFGGDGDDMIQGGIGDDIIQGGEGNDTLMGGIGADFIFGGEGNDIIKGGLPGADADEHSLGDVLSGGAGDDIFEFVAKEFESGAMDQIVDFRNGADSIVIQGVSDSVTYDSETGILSIDGTEAIDVGKGLEDVKIERQEGTNTWEML